MPTADPSNVLFRVAHPDLYERNPFNVLNLPVTATAKDIRRRKEDIEAAFDAGTEADEFRDVLPGDVTRPTPTRDQVADLFAALEDPQRRIAYALFWFWPEDVGAAASAPRKRSANSNGQFGHRSVVSGWDAEARRPDGTTPSQLVARHNLAVFHHMMGLCYELSLKKYDARQVDTPSDVPEHWRAAIHWWNAVSEDPDCWRHVSDLVTALGDPRLDYRFARSLRDQFAFSFDQINAELAIDFAKRGREEDARRQVEYMKLSQPDADDVEGTFDDAFAGLLRQVEAVVKATRDETQKDPKSGLAQANAVLAQTAEPLRVSRVVLEKGSPVRNAIVSAIFAGVRSCLIAYGNKTEDWDNCIGLTKKLKALAETPEQKKQVAEDTQIVQGNKKEKEAREQCWFCKKNKKSKVSEYSFQMYGDVVRHFGHVSWKNITVHVPRCAECAANHSNHNTNVFITLFLIFSGCLLIGHVCNPDGGGAVAGAVVGGAIWLVLKLFFGNAKTAFFRSDPWVGDFPMYQELQKIGYFRGDKPPGVQ